MAGPVLGEGWAQEQDKMLRISVEASKQVVQVQLEGHIAGPWVEALRKTCEGELSEHSRMIVDLADVSFVDRDGIALLARLTTQQVALLNPQPFVAELLKSAGVKLKVAENTG